MFRVFGFPKGGVCDPPSKYHAKDFWAYLTGGEVLKDNHTPPNGLIVDPAYLIVHKFILLAIFGKTESNKIFYQKLLMLWCMHTKLCISTSYFVLHTLWQVVQSNKIALIMGHIVTGLALHFRVFDPKIMNMERIEVGLINK